MITHIHEKAPVAKTLGDLAVGDHFSFKDRNQDTILRVSSYTHVIDRIIETSVVSSTDGWFRGFQARYGNASTARPVRLLRVMRMDFEEML